MPNHVINHIEFDCPEERLKEILSSICYDDDSEAEVTGVGTIDFNKINPMPKSLDIVSGSSTDRSIELYLTSVNPGVRYYGKEKIASAEFNSLVERLNGLRYFARYNPALTTEEIQKATMYSSEDEMLSLGKTAVDNLFQYGATTWYDWRTRGDTWNTKWNSYSPQYNGGNTITFETAWSPPHPIVEKLSAMYPDVTMMHQWANEDITQSCGSHTYLDGVMIDHEYPETDKEHLEVASGIWGYPLEDYDLYLNASGTDYVNIEMEEYELVSVCGQPGLFTNGRITTADIPQGMFLYHLRESDDGGKFCSIENNVGVNHGGCIITRDALDLGEQGYIQFNDDTSPNFMGEQITIGQFMSRNFEAKEALNIE